MRRRREREKRLIRLHTYGEINETIVREEGDLLKRERQQIEALLHKLRLAADHGLGPLDEKVPAATCAAVSARLDHAGDAERLQVLEALQVEVKAATAGAVVTGVLPVEPPGYLPGNVHRDAPSILQNRGGAVVSRSTPRCRFGRPGADRTGVHRLHLVGELVPSRLPGIPGSAIARGAAWSLTHSGHSSSVG